MNPPTEPTGLALNISAVEREAGSVQGCLADVGAPVRLSQAGARRKRGAPVFGRGGGEAPRDQAADGCRAASRQDHPAHAGRAQHAGRRPDCPPSRANGAGGGERDSRDPCKPRCLGAAEPVRESADAPGPAALRPRNPDVTQPCRRRCLDARGARGVRGTSLHGTIAGGVAHRDQCVSTAARRAADAPHDVPGRAALPSGC